MVSVAYYLRELKHIYNDNYCCVVTNTRIKAVLADGARECDVERSSVLCVHLR